MEEYRRRLERTQINFCVLLLVLLFGGVPILPRIGQAIWIAIIATEDLKEHLHIECS